MAVRHLSGPAHQAAEGTRHLDIEEMGGIRLPCSNHPIPDRRALRSRLDEEVRSPPRHPPRSLTLTLGSLRSDRLNRMGPEVYRTIGVDDLEDLVERRPLRAHALSRATGNPKAKAAKAALDESAMDPVGNVSDLDHPG